MSNATTYIIDDDRTNVAMAVRAIKTGSTNNT